MPPRVALFEVATLLLASALPRERLLGATLVSRLQVVGMLLHVLDDVFLLHLPLEAAERAFDRFAVLQFDFSQIRCHPLTARDSLIANVRDTQRCILRYAR